MNVFLEKEKFYVKDADRHVYAVKGIEINSGSLVFRLRLELVAGWDYIDPDGDDRQGWVPADRFIEEWQDVTVIVYFMSQNAEEALEDDGFEIISEISPSLQKIIDKHFA